MKRTGYFRVLALALCFVLLLACFPVSAVAADRPGSAGESVLFAAGTCKLNDGTVSRKGLLPRLILQVAASRAGNQGSVVLGLLRDLRQAFLKSFRLTIANYWYLYDTAIFEALSRREAVQPTSPSEQTTPSTPSQGSGLLTADDNDITGFTPSDWSWTAEGEGYGRRYFTSGKYVRDDGRAVLYIESSDSYDGFSFQLFAMAEGAHQDNYLSYDYQYGTSYCWASNDNEGLARDYSNGLIFRNYGNGLTIIESDWIDEMYYAYGAPDGYYYLVREKK